MAQFCKHQTLHYQLLPNQGDAHGASYSSPSIQYLYPVENGTGNPLMVLEFINVLSDFKACMSTQDRTFSFVINAIVCTLITVFGIIGNLLFLLSVFHGFWGKLAPIMTSLAVGDILMLLSGWVAFNFMGLIQDNYIQLYDTIFISFMPFIYTFANICLTVHIWTTVLINVERYLGICHPLWHRTKKPKMFTRVTIASIHIMAWVYNFPRFFEFARNERIERSDDPYSQILNSTGYPEIGSALINETVVFELRETSLRSNTYYFTGYYIIAQFTFLSIGPVAIMIILTTKILTTMYQYRQRRVKSMTNTVSFKSKPGKQKINARRVRSQPILRVITRKKSKKLKSNVRRTPLGQNTKPLLPQNEIQNHPSQIIFVNENDHSKPANAHQNGGIELNSPPPHPLPPSSGSIRVEPEHRQRAHSDSTTPTRNSEPLKHAALKKVQTASFSSNQSLVIIPLTCIACFILPSIRDAIKTFTDFNSDAYWYVNIVVSVLVPLDASINFYAYYLFSERFRKHILRILGFRKMEI